MPLGHVCRHDVDKFQTPFEGEVAKDSGRGARLRAQIIPSQDVRRGVHCTGRRYTDITTQQHITHRETGGAQTKPSNELDECS